MTTPREADCLAAIQDLTVGGVPPSYGELRDRLGLSSKSGVIRLLTSLGRQGLVEWEPRRARSIRVLAAELRPDRLEKIAPDALRVGVATIAGILALREGAAATASMLRRIADRLEVKPRRDG